MQEAYQYTLGQLVRSKAGRDKDRLFIIIGQNDDQYVTIVDGTLRRVEKPKRKKVRHLSRINRISQPVEAALRNGEPLTDALIRREIENLGSSDSPAVGRSNR